MKPSNLIFLFSEKKACPYVIFKYHVAFLVIFLVLLLLILMKLGKKNCTFSFVEKDRGTAGDENVDDGGAK